MNPRKRARSAAALFATALAQMYAGGPDLITDNRPASSVRPMRCVSPLSSAPSDGMGPAGVSRSGEAEYGMEIPWGEERFESYRSAFLSPDAKKWLGAVMRRASPYLPYINDRLRLYGLPDELAFLPVLESEFSPRAVSRSGAVGLWQFMKNSIAGYGMNIDEWVDERRDFMKSTDGALRKLADNYATFGDWPLALAAYNAGAGAVSRAIAAAERQGAASPDYWELCRRKLLSAEATSYVPKFFALVSILRYPARSGLGLTWEEPITWEILRPGRPVSIVLTAQRAGVDPEILREANPELRYGITPPRRDYALKVPSRFAEAVRAALMETGVETSAYHLYPVRSGDTLSTIARNYGIPLSSIIAANPNLDPDRIRIGQNIVIPLPPEAAAAVKSAAAVDEPAPAFLGTHIVARGDTLWSIALKYSVQVELLAERNGLDIKSFIREGTSLHVPILETRP